MPKLQEFVVTLKRQKASIPWGIRLVGGSDLETPLIITKVPTNILNIIYCNKKL